MSADKWSVCPRCAAARERTALDYKLKAEKSYGKVSPEEYQALLEKALAGPDQLEATLREDYDIGIFRGKFSVDYAASCQAEGCGFKHIFKVKEKLVK